MTPRVFLRRYWWTLVTIAAILLSIAFSAAFGWDAISDDPRRFFKRWAIDWLPALATFVVAFAALQQVTAIRRGQQIEFAPVLRLDLETRNARPTSSPATGDYVDPLEDEELDWQRDADAGEQYLMLKIHNLQKHPAGSANEVEIKVSLWLPTEEYSFSVPIGHVAPNAGETHALVNLGGLNWSTAEVVSIEFQDDSGARYTKAHGLAVLERTRDGTVEPGYLVIDY